MRALVLAALALAGCASPLFVDQIDEGQAVLIDAEGHVFHLPASQLPPDAGEGRWLGDPPDPKQRQRVAELRARLTRGDDGADITLR